jgi:3D (Asp-Asp-Asp) domain-containing protein
VGLLAAALLVAGAGCARLRPVPTPTAQPQVVDFEATAYCITGTTASGMQTRPGIVAADPALLPIGSRIRVDGAGSYSGEYTVADTGPAVRGREIDIFIPDLDAAKRFGRRRVQVRILERGSGPRH